MLWIKGGGLKSGFGAKTVYLVDGPGRMLAPCRILRNREMRNFGEEWLQTHQIPPTAGGSLREAPLVLLFSV